MLGNHSEDLPTGLVTGSLPYGSVVLTSDAPDGMAFSSAMRASFAASSVEVSWGSDATGDLS